MIPAMDTSALMSEDWTAGFQAGLARARQEYEPRIAALEAQVAELAARLAERESRPPKTSQNSSLPPSSDPPSAPKRRPKRPTGRKRGAQKGHPGHTRQLVEPNQVDEVIDHHPQECPKCQTTLPSELPDASPPVRQQAWELPKVKPIVTEHRQHTVECPECHTLVKAPDSDMPRATFGPRATAVASVLHGRFRLSLRETATVFQVIGGLPVSLGGVAGMCQETTKALAEPYAKTAGLVRAEPVANVDETSWRQAGTRPWIWTMVGKQATFFRVLPRRNSDALKQLLGADYSGTVISDRFKAYRCLPVERRGVCWAHLKRDFQSFVDLGDQTRAWGQQLLEVEREVFREWHRFREGQLDRAALLVALKPIQDKLSTLLEEGLERGQSEGFCRDLLGLWPALWAFAEREGVEPTNNAAEQALRPVVLWRKGCFGAFSDWGNQFVERILSVSATCRQQALNLVDTVVDALLTWRAANPQAHPA
jgi:transposase